MSMKQILIVDDEALVIRVLKLALERAGFDVVARRNGAEAYERILESEPDVLITDIEMPRMTGQELCQKIHENLPNRSFPIFVATSVTAIEHRVWSDAIPNLRFLEKPVSAGRLIEAINGVLNAEDAIRAESGSGP